MAGVLNGISRAMAGVLNGIKVLDLSWGIAGPMTAMLLGDHGADVTRIERPLGDPFPDLLGYKVWHRGKRNAVFDLKDPGDHALFLKLAADADILIESFSPGVTTRLGIDYKSLAALNPKLIHASITAYGEGTPDADRKGYDALVSARCGMQYEQRGFPEGSVWRMTGEPNPYAEAAGIEQEWLQGADREGPLNVASHWPSMGAFFSLSTGLAAALFARERTGRGQHVETSLLQGAMACCSGVWQRMENSQVPGFNMWVLASSSPKGHYRTSDDRWIHNWVPNPRFVLQAAKGDTLSATPDLTVQSDPDRFGVGPEEVLVMAHYQPLLADAVRKFTAAEWTHAAAVAGVPLQECRSIEESLVDPLLLEDEVVTTVEDPELGPINQVGITYRLSDRPTKVSGPTRARGADTASVKADAARLPDRKPAAQAAAPTNTAPLKGIRVIDLGFAVAGPFGTQLLADLGAEVIKINSPWDGYWHGTHIAYMANRGKRSISLMLKHPKGLALLKKLIAGADVFHHNMRYAAIQRLGLDYETLSKEFPQLIYCHTRGFEKGPRMNLPGNDQTGACLAGIQHEDGGVAAGGKPIWSLTSLGDTGNGFLSAIAVLNALFDRTKTGKGQFVDTSIINACLLNTSYAVAKSDGSAVPRPRLDAMQLGTSPYYRLYKTADGWVQVAAISPAEKAGFDKLTGGNAEAQAAAQDTASWLAALQSAGVPAEFSDPNISLSVFDNELYKARQWTTSYRDEAVGNLEQIGFTYSLSDTPGVIQGPPVRVGRETTEILTAMGITEEEIDALVEESVVFCYPPRKGQKTFRASYE